ncbi:MAG: SMC family ATPase [Gemmataceae bacterium]|nr:SMC family ATPase [Gemmataceae bacterium]
MIPQRIRVRGFLCYRDEQEVSFDSASLWMLAGVNGSGKSAIFDGVTYALFGGHRAGKEHADELINKGSDRALVEFDFLLDGHLYRARRTLKLKKQGGAASTQQIERWDTDANRWKPVEDTTNKRDFDRWVHENVGLTYETFTSSVLLMQNRAEKLLEAGPKGRFEVLAGVVDLDRFQRLHERADARRRELKEQLERTQLRLNELPEVGAAELEAADERIVRAQETVDRCQGESQQLQRLLIQAEQWRALQGKRTEAQQRCSAYRTLLADAEGIETAWARLQELRDVLPRIRSLAEQRQRLKASSERCTRLVGEQRGLAENLGRLGAEAEQVRKRQDVLQQSLADAQLREQVVNGRLRELSTMLAAVHFCEQQRRELARIDAELAAFPAEPGALVAQLQREHDRLALLSQALPLLNHFQTARTELIAARERLQAAFREGTTARQAEAKLTAELAVLGPLLDDATLARQKADELATETRTLFEQARKDLEQLNELSGAKLCRLCGQLLTPGHIIEERTRRGNTRTAAEAACQQAAQSRTQVVQLEKRLQDEKQTLESRLAAVRDQIKERLRKHAEAERDIQRLGADLLRDYQGLPDALRLRIGSEPPDQWQSTVFPTSRDLATLKAQAQGKAAALHELQSAQAGAEKWTRLQAQRETTQRTLKTQEAALPAEPTALQEEYTRLEAEDTALKKSLLTQRTEWKTNQAAAERLQLEVRTLREQLADKEQQASAEEVRREAFQKAVDCARTALPAEWQTKADAARSGDLERWQSEYQTLEQQNILARREELAQARAGLQAVQQRLEELEQEVEKVPADARCDPAALKLRAVALAQEQTLYDAELREVHKQRDRLQERQAQRRELSDTHAEQDRQHNLHRLLAELLGRNRLQLYLVRQAERGIVDYANAVLDRLSGGQLYLRLRGEEDSDADQALQLEAYNRGTGETPIGVAFLSGSQRFRVAVSLALGIGQYASRQHRPIESVIIDEGFGCLDRQGRQVMIQELQNLRGQLRCILLVSHQEEFADAFADGYRFELTNGTTQVTRFQR